MDLLGQSNDEMLWEVVTPVIMQDREMLARLMTAVTQEEWDIAMTRMLEASFPQFPRKKWTDAETKDTVLRLRRRAADGDDLLLAAQQRLLKKKAYMEENT